MTATYRCNVVVSGYLDDGRSIIIYSGIR